MDEWLICCGGQGIKKEGWMGWGWDGGDGEAGYSTLRSYDSRTGWDYRLEHMRDVECSTAATVSVYLPHKHKQEGHMRLFVYSTQTASIALDQASIIIVHSGEQALHHPPT